MTKHYIHNLKNQLGVTWQKLDQLGKSWTNLHDPVKNQYFLLTELRDSLTVNTLIRSGSLYLTTLSRECSNIIIGTKLSTYYVLLLLLNNIASM